mmetsp:Transcript_11643/g.12793  ORF Transcript_11643/g.12793 Transcript_11643/m.12793 type:complete len:110 (-) Transcript_11643:142-471(-)
MNLLKALRKYLEVKQKVQKEKAHAVVYCRQPSTGRVQWADDNGKPLTKTKKCRKSKALDKYRASELDCTPEEAFARAQKEMEEEDSESSREESMRLLAESNADLNRTPR